MKAVLSELKRHMPFTLSGAAFGIIFMILFRNISHETAHELFFVFHPLHVLLSALVTASIYTLHTCPREGSRRCNLPILLAIGFVGSVGIATLSDSLIPYIAEVLLDMPFRHHHIGIVEKWWLVSGVAVVGVVLAYFNPTTKFPHAGHVLISTWASLFHILMAKGAEISILAYAGIFTFLFLAVWLPCCISDIAFPMFFVDSVKRQRAAD